MHGGSGHTGKPSYSLIARCQTASFRKTPAPGRWGRRGLGSGLGIGIIGQMATRILVTADLHYNIPRSRGPTEALARRACRIGGDAIVLAGDTAGADLGPLRDCLRLFEGFGGRKLLVVGNHCLWCRNGESSMDRYERILPELAREEGFHVLDTEPACLDGVGLVGSVGWYDYSFRDRSLGLPEAFYRAKVSPGAAAWLGGYEELLDAHRDVLTDAHMGLGVRWMDGVHVRLHVEDEQFVAMLAEKLRWHLQAAAARSRRVLAFLHHLPFAELLPTGRPRKRAFGAAYLGSDRLGSVLRRCDRVTDVYCGHSHWAAEARIGRIHAVSVGSTYTSKHLRTIDVEEDCREES